MNGPTDHPWRCALIHEPAHDAEGSLVLAERLRQGGQLPRVGNLKLVASYSFEGVRRSHIVGRTDMPVSWISRAGPSGDDLERARLIREHAAFMALRLTEHTRVGDLAAAYRTSALGEHLSDVAVIGLSTGYRSFRGHPTRVILFNAIGRDARRSLQRVELVHDDLQTDVDRVMQRHVAGLEIAAKREELLKIGAVDEIALKIMRACGVRLQEVLEGLTHQPSIFFQPQNRAFSGIFMWRDFRIVADISHPTFELFGNVITVPQIFPPTVLASFGGRRLGDLMEIPVIPADIVIQNADANGSGSCDVHLQTRVVEFGRDFRVTDDN